MALDINRQSDGAFDIGIGALVNSWGLGHVKPQGSAQPVGTVKRQVAHAASEMREIDHANLQVRNLFDTTLDLTGIREVMGVMELCDAAIATSGDYRRFVDLAGERYAHTMHPLLGAPVRNRVAAVTVAASSCKLADAWATALLVLGEEAGVALAQKRGMDAVFVLRDGAGFEVISITAGQIEIQNLPIGPSGLRPTNNGHRSRSLTFSSRPHRHALLGWTPAGQLCLVKRRPPRPRNLQ